MFNPIFNKTVQGRKHPESCAFAEPELLSYGKPLKGVVQNEKNGHKNPNNSHNYHDERELKEIIKGAHNDTQHQNNAHPENSPIDCDGMQLTNAQCPWYLMTYVGDI